VMRSHRGNEFGVMREHENEGRKQRNRMQRLARGFGSGYRQRPPAGSR
jgi:hypothetical protein